MQGSREPQDPQALQKPCRDFYNEDAPIWESGFLRCWHCNHEWLGVFLARKTSLECPGCHRTTRKRVIGDI